MTPLRFTRREMLLGARNDLARGDADATLEPELGEGRAHLECSAARAQRVVLMRDRDAEHGHDRCAIQAEPCPLRVLFPAAPRTSA